MRLVIQTIPRAQWNFLRIDGLHGRHGVVGPGPPARHDHGLPGVHDVFHGHAGGQRPRRPQRVCRQCGLVALLGFADGRGVTGCRGCCAGVCAGTGIGGSGSMVCGHGVWPWCAGRYAMATGLVRPGRMDGMGDA